jgi:hypothetical protein
MDVIKVGIISSTLDPKEVMVVERYLFEGTPEEL